MSGRNSYSSSQYEKKQTRSGGGSIREKAAQDYREKKALEKEWKSDPREALHTKRSNPLAVTVGCAATADVVKDLQQSVDDIAPHSVSVDEAIDNSYKFWEVFPSETARLHSLCNKKVPKSLLQKCLDSVYPLLNEATLNLCHDFLVFKRKSGTAVEKALYKDMNLVSFVDRLIKKRPLSFLGANDQHLLRCATIHGYGGFQEIGTDQEKPPRVLAEYLSYDEMRIAALLSLSSWSVFVNDGTRKNYGKPGKEGTYQQTGVIVGQVGARLKKEGVMEYLDCVISKNQNMEANGFGSGSRFHLNSVFEKFWGVPLLSYEEATALVRDPQAQRQRNMELMAIGKSLIFNITIYKKRIALTAEILLCEANARAKEENLKAYIHVVGLGLGVWRASEKQEELFIEAWGDALDSTKNLLHVSTIDFSWIAAKEIKGVKNEELYKNTGIKIKFSKRNLHDSVPSDCLLVCNYAWDGNSFPGNEFYLEKLCSTGDSAAACSSMVAEVHNYIVNPRVDGKCLRVSNSDGRLKDIATLTGTATASSQMKSASQPQMKPVSQPQTKPASPPMKPASPPQKAASPPPQKAASPPSDESSVTKSEMTKQIKRKETSSDDVDKRQEEASKRLQNSPEDDKSSPPKVELDAPTKPKNRKKSKGAKKGKKNADSKKNDELAFDITELDFKSFGKLPDTPKNHEMEKTEQMTASSASCEREEAACQKLSVVLMGQALRELPVEGDFSFAAERFLSHKLKRNIPPLFSAYRLEGMNKTAEITSRSKVVVTFKNLEDKDVMVRACRHSNPQGLYYKDFLSPENQEILRVVENIRRDFPRVVSRCGSQHGRVFLLQFADRSKVWIDSWEMLEKWCHRQLTVSPSTFIA